MIEVRALSKEFRIHIKEPGLAGSLRALVRRKYVTRKAVREVSLNVGEGEIVGLVGANGAGKTTLVKMLAGIIHPSSGDARVLGYRPWERHNDLRQRIALIMGQKASLWWDLPAADCFLLLREIYRLPQQEFERNLKLLTGMLDVEDQLRVQIRRLSLGERMKMELIAALLHQPRIVYLDEPTIGLDLTTQQAIRSFILEYRSQHRPAMLLTSHYMEDIERLCQRILILREGELVYDGPLQEVVRKYAPHKVVRVRLRPGETPSLPALDDLPLRVTRSEAQELQFEIARDDVLAATGELVRRLPVHDLSIEEPDIGTVIEKLIRVRRDTRSEAQA